MNGFRLKRKSGSQGFTLFETLLALSLSGLIIAILAGSYVESAHTQQAVAGQVTGLLLGRSKLAEIIQGSEPASSGEFNPSYRQYQWMAAEETSDTGVRSVHLTVKWRNENGMVRQVQLQAYRNPE